jgi:16S rRNA (uracil1498-N3)-methyltransferase
MLRFFVRPTDINGCDISLTREQYHYLATVLRKKVGDSLEIVIESVCMMTAQIQSLDSRLLQIKIVSEHPISAKRCRLVLVQAIPKGDKMGDIIRRCTELGVDEFVPVMMSRCVPQWNAKQLLDRVGRWEKIAHEASQQAHRVSVPVVHPVMTLQDVAMHFKDADLKLVPWECEQDHDIKSVLKKASPMGTVVVVIGPEGGIDATEIDFLHSQGFSAVSISDTILRVENAGFLTFGVIRYEFA